MRYTSEQIGDFPILDGRTPTQRHANICALRGHATHTANGVDTEICPRCGVVKDPAAETAGAAYRAAAETIREAHHHAAYADGQGQYYRSQAAFKAVIHAAYPKIDAAGVYGLWIDCMESVAYCAETFLLLDRDERRKYISMGGGE